MFRRHHFDRSQSWQPLQRRGHFLCADYQQAQDLEYCPKVQCRFSLQCY